MVFYEYSLSDKKFKETIAHETGHAIVETYAGFNESVTHHGSSGYDQNPKAGTIYPKTGEIDLMKYAKGNLLTISGWDTRMVANEKDTMGLLFISGISKNEKIFNILFLILSCSIASGCTKKFYI